MDVERTLQLGGPFSVLLDQLGPIGPRADLYAVGVVLFEALTGAPPFADGDLPALLRAVATDVPPVPSEQIELPIAVRADLDRLIGSCLSKDPAQRPQSAQEIAMALDRIAAQLEREMQLEVLERTRLIQSVPKCSSMAALARRTSPDS